MSTCLSIRVMIFIETTTYAESVSWTPFFEIGPPIGPIEKGITYIVLPFIQPGNRLSMAPCKSPGEIHLPNLP